jgi:VIT1/CCC1 family predicted Fe2+/Mn2+ transporter
MPLGGCLLLAAASWVSARSTGRSMIEFFAVGVVMAVVTGGVTYALSQWFAQFITRPNGE